MQTQRAKTSKPTQPSNISLKMLSHSQVQRIDDMLSELGPYGELRLIKKKGLLRFVEKVESFDFLDERESYESENR
jgi:hypothetical protein